jgi:protein tyrosine phosphatase (PTP) superfamily phosphohydrolase (DUF442 family)
MDAENFYQVFDWLWTSGQLSERDIAELPALGIKSVINLALPSASNALPGEAERVTGAGINYIQIPVPWEKPELYHLRLFCTLLQTLQGEPTWIHCAKNMRVSVFIYLYRYLYLHESEESAAFPLTTVWEPNEIWRNFIDDARQNHSVFSTSIASSH